ncbi:hypothetical protein ADUPG1_003771, partial [Aduncisulcus paluster]
MDTTDESIEQTKMQAEKLSMGDILRSIDILTKLEAQSRWATQPRIHLEMTLVKLMQPETDQTIEGLLARIEKLENALSSGVSLRPNVPVTTEARAQAPVSSQPASKAVSEPISKPAPKIEPAPAPVAEAVPSN